MGPRRRILVVHAAETPLADDVAALAGRLAVAGCSVTVLTDFREARRYIADAAPDAVLTDLRLGAHNGLHLVVAADEPLRAMPNASAPRSSRTRSFPAFSRKRSRRCSRAKG